MTRMTLTPIFQSAVLFLASLLLVSLASKQFGNFFIKIKLPLITGFLFAGIVAGPTGLNIISTEAVKSLRYVDQIALGFIAFCAGGELYLHELKDLLKGIKWITVGLVLSTFSLGGLTIFMLTDFIPMINEMPLSGRIAVSLLAGSILVARSPSSAIAVIKELRAKGPFTQTALGVTVIMDGVVIVIFAINYSIADAMLNNTSTNLGFVVLLAAELSASLAIGVGLGKLLGFIASRKWDPTITSTLALMLGYGIFFASDFIRYYTAANYASEVLLEPLLICMIGGFHVANYSTYREDFQRILHHVSPLIYLIFFTLIGASLQLNILLDIWPITLAIFVARIAAIFAGSYTAGVFVKNPPAHNRISWMAYITQAGIGLGLTTEVAVEFPEWGPTFATLMISVIVINQIVGPTFFKMAIHLVNESQPLPAKTEVGVLHNAIILGSDGRAFALARQLHFHHWQVKMATLLPPDQESSVKSGVEVHFVSELSANELKFLGGARAGAIVTMLSDEENLRVCEIAHEHFSEAHLIVQLSDRSKIEQFKPFGASIVVPSTAMISLLDHYVRSPSAVSLLLGMEENQDIIDLDVRNISVAESTLQDLELPEDVLIISIHRGRDVLVPHEYLHIKEGDVLTLAGPEKTLEVLSVRFES
jgi:Kef-type K+ transport system membrane component KefB/Trk K+ transport system NAD-binding subunit